MGPDKLTQVRSRNERAQHLCGVKDNGDALEISIYRLLLAHNDYLVASHQS